MSPRQPGNPRLAMSRASGWPSIIIVSRDGDPRLSSALGTLAGRPVVGGYIDRWKSGSARTP
jgi:hypothetical protein